MQLFLYIEELFFIVFCCEIISFKNLLEIIHENIILLSVGLSKSTEALGTYNECQNNYFNILEIITIVLFVLL